MPWGVDGKEGVDSERLKPLGLYCPGGGTNKNGDYYSVWYNHVRYELSKEEFNNIERWLRKIKLEKLNESN